MSNLLKDASILLTPTGYDNGSMNAIKPENGDGDFTFSRNSAATRVNAQGLVENVQIISPELVSNGDFSQIGTEEVLNGNFSQEGSELVTNGDFTTDSDWSQLTNSSIINGKLVFNGSGLPRQANVFQSNKTFKITLNVSDYTSGQVRVVSSGYANVSDYFDSVGVYTFYFNCGSLSTTEVFIQSLSFIGSIDSISVKEVGQNWDLDTGWSIGDDKVEADGTSAFLIQSNFQSVASVKSYKIQYEVLSTNGVNIRFGGGSSMFGTPTLDTTTIGVKTIYLQSNGTVKNLQFQNNLGFIGSITNISVKEVGQDWDLGTGWSIGEDKVVATDVDSTFLDQLNILTAGKLYKITYTILDYVSGSVRFRANLVNGSSNSANGTYTDYIVSAGTKFSLQGLNNFNGSITNISVKEITDDTDIPRINYSGFSYQDSLGSELVTNGDFSNGSANFLKSNNVYITTNSCNFDNTSDNTAVCFIQQSGILQSSKSYKVTINVSNYVTGDLKLIGVSGSADFQITQSGQYTLNVEATQINLAINCDSGVDCNVTIDNVSVKEVTGQEVVPDSGCGSWLLEPQSTNLVTYSEDFSDAYWTKSSVTLTSGFTAPDGSNNAYKVEGTIGTSYLANLTANTHLRSIYVRTVSGTGQIKLLGNTTLYDVTEQWTRFSFNPTSNTYQFAVDFRGGTDISEVLIWGAQVENQSYATSYIPTNGATNTRLQDIATNSGNSSLINSTEGVLYAEIAALANDGHNGYISLSDGSLSNYVYIRTTGSLNQIKMGVVKGSSTQASRDETLSDITQFNKIAISYSQDLFKFYVNGTLIFTDTNGDTFSADTLDRLNFDIGTNGFNKLFAEVKALVVYKEALTDANLRCLTYPPAVATTFDLDFDTIAEQFTFTRGSEATFVNEQGLIESTNTLTSNLVIDEESLLLTGWSRDGDVYTAVNAAGNVALNHTSGFNFSIGDLVEVSYEVFDYVSGQPRIQLSGGGAASYGALINSNGVFTETLTLTGNNTAGAIISNNSNPTLKIKNLSIKKIITATNTPRIDYSTGAKAFLLEPQSTNYSTNSEQPSTWHSSRGVTITANAATSPEGLQNSSLVVNNASSGNRYSRNRFVFPSGSGLQTVTLSYFIKYYNNQWVRLKSDFFTGSPANGKSTYFDIQNGVIGTSDATHTAKMEDYGDGWYRCSITFDIDKSVDSDGYGHIEAMVGDNSNAFAANGQGYYAYGSQGEEFSYPTSYIPSRAAFTTRNQELCLDATPVINSTEGTLYAEISALANDGTYRMISISDGTNDNRITLYLLQANKISVLVKESNTTQAQMTYTINDVTDFNKIAFKYKENNFALWINGVEVATDTSGNVPTSLSKLHFSTGDGINFPFFGNTKGLKYYPKALADVQLEDLTTI